MSKHSRAALSQEKSPARSNTFAETHAAGDREQRVALRGAACSQKSPRLQQHIFALVDAANENQIRTIQREFFPHGLNDFNWARRKALAASFVNNTQL